MCISELVVSLDVMFKVAPERNEVCGKVIIIAGGLPGFLGACFSDRVSSALIVSVSMTVVLRGVKNLRVNVAFEGSLTAAGVGTGLSHFLVVSSVLLQVCILRHVTFWKSPSCAVDSTEVLFVTPLCPACAHIFWTPFSSFSVIVYMP